MSNAWSGVDPTQSSDSGSYSLGATFTANVAITVTGVRVWAGATPGTRASRKARLWTTAEAQLGIATLPDDLPAGWSAYDLATPVDLDAGDMATVAWDTGGFYGEINDAFDNEVISADEAVTFLSGAEAPHGNGSFTTSVGSYPDVASSQHTYYGIDIVYTVTSGDNTAPTIGTVDVAATGATATVTINATDTEGLDGATYRVEWGDTTSTSGSSATLTHTYAASGLYPLLCQVTDSGGLTDFKAAVADIAVLSTPAHYATTRKVAVAWLTALGLNAAAELPTDQTLWADTGFVTPTGSGGSSNIDIPLIQPVVTLKCWANTPDSGEPPWNKATELAERIRWACFDGTGMTEFLTLDHCDQKARVINAQVITEPRPSYSDDGDYACAVLDVRLHWIVQSQ